MDEQRMSQLKLRSILVRRNIKKINSVEKLRNTICENLFTPSLAVIRLVIMSRRFLINELRYLLFSIHRLLS